MATGGVPTRLLRVNHPAGEGRSPEEWLRLLGDQRRALRQREAFTGRDHSNHSRLRS